MKTKLLNCDAVDGQCTGAASEANGSTKHEGFLASFTLLVLQSFGMGPPTKKLCEAPWSAAARRRLGVTLTMRTTMRTKAASSRRTPRCFAQRYSREQP